MPPIQSQSIVISPDGATGTITIVSSTDGTIVITGIRSGSTVTMEMKKNGVLVSGAGITNPQALGTATQAQIENWINSTFLAVGSISFRLASHVFTLVPLNLTITCYNPGVILPAQWWL